MLLRLNFGKPKRGQSLCKRYIIFYIKQKVRGVNKISKTDIKIRCFSMGYCKVISCVCNISSCVSLSSRVRERFVIESGGIY